MASAHLVDLNFKVPPAVRHDFKRLAAHHGTTGVALLRAAVAEWTARHGGPAPIKSRPTTKATTAAGLSVTVTVNDGGRA